MSPLAWILYNSEDVGKLLTWAEFGFWRKLAWVRNVVWHLASWRKLLFLERDEIIEQWKQSYFMGALTGTHLKFHWIGMWLMPKSLKLTNWDWVTSQWEFEF